MDSFDPYHIWLAIPPEKQPPNHYDLLGIPPFESNTEVIAYAADQRMGHLRNLATGKYSEHSQKLLNEVAGAKLCLLNDEMKARYDAKLRGTVETPGALDSKPAAPPVVQVSPLPRRKQRRWAWCAVPPLVKWIASGVIATAVLLTVVILLQTPHGTIKFEISDPNMRVAIDDGVYRISDGAKSQLRTGSHTFKIRLGETEIPVDKTVTLSQRGYDGEFLLEVKYGEAKLSSGSFKVVKGQRIVANVTLMKVGKIAVSENDGDLAPDLNYDAELLAAEIAAIKEKYVETLELGGKLEKRQLVNALLEAATRVDSEQRVKRCAYLQVGSALAFEIGAFDVGLDGCDEMARSLDADSLDFKTKLLTQTAVGDAGHAEELAKTALRIGFRCWSLDRYEQASLLAAVALKSSERCKRPDLRYQGEFLDAEATRAHPQYTRVKAYLEIVARDPTNSEANLEVGKFLCFVKNDWQRGLQLLAKGSNVGLADISQKELSCESHPEADRWQVKDRHRRFLAEHKQPSDPNKRVELGDAWWELSKNTEDDRTALQRRARYWYLKAFAAGKESIENGIRDQVNSRLDQVPTQSAVLRFYFPSVSGSHQLAISTEGLRSLYNSYNWPDIPVNHLVHDPDAAPVLPNTGVSRLLPDVLDYSTAKLIVNHKSKSYGDAAVWVQQDCVVLRVLNSYKGGIDFDVTVTFGD